MAAHRHRTPTPHPTRAEVHTYALALHSRLVEIVSARFGNRDLAEETASTEIIRFLENPQAVMAKYADPVRYGSARATHAALDFQRQTRVQRGEGARGGRRAVWGDAPIDEDGTTLFDLMEEKYSDHADRAVDQVMVGEVLDALPELQRTIAVRVIGLDETAGSVAADLGYSRETVQRKIKPATELMREEWRRFSA